MKKTLSICLFLFVFFGCSKESSTKVCPNKTLKSSAPTVVSSSSDCTPSYNSNEIPYVNCFATYKICIKQLKKEGCNMITQHKFFAVSYSHRISPTQIKTTMVELGELKDGNSIVCSNVSLPLGFCMNFGVSGGCPCQNPCPFEITITPGGSCPAGTTIISKTIIVNDGQSTYVTLPANPCKITCL